MLEAHLEQREVLSGEAFTVADAYLVWALMLMRHANISLEPYPALRRYLKHHGSRPSVAAAVAFERAQLREAAGVAGAA